MKLVEIAMGWYNFINGTAAVQQMMYARLQVCDGCPHKAQLSPMGKKLIQAFNSKANTFYCKECTCPLVSKTSSPDSACPLDKWKAWESPENYY